MLCRRCVFANQHHQYDHLNSHNFFPFFFHFLVNFFQIFFTDIGAKRVIFSDQNFPLEGVQSALGRSIVLFGPNYSPERFGCANIEADHDIVKYVNLQRPPKFVV